MQLCSWCTCRRQDLGYCCRSPQGAGSRFRTCNKFLQVRRESPSQGAWRGTATSLELADELSEEQRLSDPIRADAPPALLPRRDRIPRKSAVANVIAFDLGNPENSRLLLQDPARNDPNRLPNRAPESPQCGYCISPVGLRVPLRPCDTESI